MDTVTKRELNQDTASVLARVTATNDITVTERGVPRWQISLLTPGASTLTRLQDEGLYTPPATNPAPWPSHSAGPKYTEEQIAELLADIRGDH